MAAIMEYGAAPAARGYGVRGWWAAWTARRACRASMALVPDHLRADVGLDGGRRLAGYQNGGRSFIIDGRPNSALCGWTW